MKPIIVTVLLAGSLLASGCGADLEEGVLHAITPDPSSYDPVKSNKAHELTLLSLIHDRLVHIDPDKSDLVPGLAESWRASDNDRVWTFTLRPDAATPDGKRFTSEDVLFSAELYAREDLNSPRRPSLIVGGVPLKITAPDERTVVFQASSAAPFLPWSIADLLILESDLYRGISGSKDDWTKALWKTAKLDLLQGYGPFSIGSKDAKRIRLVPNPNFWGKGEDGVRLPLLKGIELTLIDDPAIAGTRFLNDGDYPARILAPTDRGAFEGKPGFEIVELGGDESTMFWWVNQNPNAHGIDPEKLRIFRTPEFRLGLAHGLNRGEVIRRAFLGNAQPLYGPISPAFPWARPEGIDLKDLTPEETQLKKARELIAKVDGVVWSESKKRFYHKNQSGDQVPLGFVLYTTPSPGDVRRLAAATVARQLGRIGLTVTPRVEEFNVIVKRIDETFDYEACLMFLESSGHASAMRGIFHSSSGMHFFCPYQKESSGWEREVDERYDAYVARGDEADLAAVLRLWTENQPVFYLATGNKALVVRDGWDVRGHATTGKSRDPLLDRPHAERLTVTRAENGSGSGR